MAPSDLQDSPEPAAKRIALWRRLKGMDAVSLQNGVCLLPRTDDHVRRLKMLENDWRLTAAILAVVGTAGGLAEWSDLDPVVPGAILLVGCLGVLVAGVLGTAAARRHGGR